MCRDFHVESEFRVRVGGAFPVLRMEGQVGLVRRRKQGLRRSWEELQQSGLGSPVDGNTASDLRIMSHVAWKIRKLYSGQLQFF